MTQFQKNIPLNIAGPSYQSRSAPLSSQETRNFYPQFSNEGREQFVIHSFPGLKNVGSVTGVDRGGAQMAEVGYRVAGTTLYSFSAGGFHTMVGSVPGVERCIFANDGTNLVIVDPGVAVYVYNGSTVSTVTDTNIAGSIAVTFINNQMVYSKPALFVVADVGDPTSASGLNAAAAESRPDDLVRAYAFQQSVYMFGVRSIEPWWNSGDGNPPLERIDGQIIEVGCAATHSIASTDEAVYWLGDDNAVYQASGGASNRISSIAISNAISSYASVSDAIGYTFTMEGQNFYVLSFPQENKTWCLSESLKVNGWFELSSGLGGGIYQGSSHVNVYNKNFIFDKINGSLYELDLDTYMNNGETILRRRVTGTIDGKILGAAGNRLQMSRMELIMETGVGLITGQGENPQIIIDISYDGGRSWVSKGFVRVGRLGEFTLRVELFDLSTFYTAIFRISSSDPVPIEIYSGTIDLRLAGR